MSNIMSEIVFSKDTFHIWFSKGDRSPYWISDEEGTELDSFETLEEAKEHLNLTIQEGWYKGE